MFINSGEFKQIIEIQRYIDGVDSDDIPIKEWKTIYKCRAKVINVHGEEFIQAQAISVKLLKTFYIRVNPAIKINEDDRILYNGNYYNIYYANDIKEERKLLELKCKSIK